MDYGHGLRLSNSFNSRLQLTNYQVKVPGTPEGQGETARSDYEYFADGRIELSNDLTNPGFNRTFGYDHVGRLTGAAASNSAFSLSMGFDPFNNMTERSTHSWQAFHNFTSQYQNNRNVQTIIWVPPSIYETTNWTHDAAGNVTRDHNKEYTFDAAGNQVRVFETTQIDPTLVKKLWIHTDHDANGVRAKRVEQEQYNLGAYTFKTSYYLRSSVLNGKVVNELNEYGQKREANVYANGERLVHQKDNQVLWTHNDRVTHSTRETNSSGSLVWHFEFDPLGNDAPVADPTPPEDPTPDYLYVGNYGNNGNPYDGPSGCMIDGQAVSCSQAVKLRRSGNPSGMAASDGTAASATVLDRVWVDEWEDYNDGTPITRGPNGEYNVPALRSRNVGSFQPVSGGTLSTSVQQRQPQNPAPNLSDLESRITKMVSNPDCAKFIRDLINGTATAKNPAAFTDALVGFNTIKKQGSFIYGDTIMKAYGFAGGTVRGSISTGNAQVNLRLLFHFVRMAR